MADKSESKPSPRKRADVLLVERGAQLGGTMTTFGNSPMILLNDLLDSANRNLPQGATAVDFAYSVHTNLGHRCRGARVDGAMVPLNTPL